MKTIKVKNIILGEGLPKIAVPIAASDKKTASSLAEEAVRAGADLIEFRADSCAGVTDPADLIGILQAAAAAVPETPVLFTCRTAYEGGTGSTSPEEYASLLLLAAESGACDLIDVEYERENAPELVAQLKQEGISVILSYHDFHGTPSYEELLMRLRKMEEMGGDIAKIACMPAKRGDTETVLAASAQAGRLLAIPYLMIAMGDAGRLSRLSAEAYGSAVTFGCLPGSASAPGQMSAPALKAELRALHDLRAKTGGFIFLTGFMGTGKSSSARSLSARTGMRVIEMDTAIEKKQGRTISEIFASEGEAAFRCMETEMLAGFCREKGAIISCGGGLVLRPENVALMKALGKVILLTAEPESILKRLTGKADERPLIRDRMTIGGISELMEERRPFYEAAADIRIATDGKRTPDISREISENI